MLRSVLREAAAGQGRAAIVVGAPGIGKTALLRHASRQAQARGMAVLAARGTELEVHFPYGVARQLFEPALRRAGREEQEDLLSGPASMAGPVLGEAVTSAVTAEGLSAADRPARPHTVVARAYGLYWLAVKLSERCPLLLVVDDAHWADTASARFLSFTSRRLEGVPLALVVAARTDGHGKVLGAASELFDEPEVRKICPGPLSERSVAHLVASCLGRPPEPAFTAACAEATGGNPFLLHELLAALTSEGVEPVAANAGDVLRRGPATVVRKILGGGATAQAEALARAVAVLGRQADLPRAVRLAGIEAEEALAALDALVCGHVLKFGPHLEFVHPLSQAAVYESIPPGERSRLHRAAAGLLAKEGAEPGSVALQLLASGPTGSPAVVSTLREAACAALERGAPEDAIAYLSRALEEGGKRELRATIYFELGKAQRLTGNSACIQSLTEARRLASSPVLRGNAAFELAGALAMSGEWEAPLAIADEALAELDNLAPELSLRLERLRAGVSAYDPRLVHEFDRRLELYRDLASQQRPPARAIALLLANIEVLRGAEGPGDALHLGQDWGVDELVAAGMEEWGVAQGLAALVYSEQLAQARDVAEALLCSAKARGFVFAVFGALGYRGFIEARSGNLAAAEQELRAALEPALDAGFAFAVPSLLNFATDVVVERPEAADFLSIAEGFELGPMASVANGALFFDMRGRARHAAGSTAQGVEDMRRAGEIYTKLGFRNPNASNWRSELALMTRQDDPEGAYGLAHQELEDARRAGHPRAIGAALRALGLIVGGLDGLRHLEEAVKTLDGSPARLVYARALVDYGSALRRLGERAAARKPLVAGLDEAVRAGATRLIERAKLELAASGARPRRLQASGPESLTPSELRVAHLAAEGRTNLEIARALFVTPKTVDTHLSHIYGKLGISSRRALRAALEPLQRERPCT
jgi:DNA-binding CsgD family transcriptional regulator/tetratricopeptide (TPR) repeat protein